MDFYKGSNRILYIKIASVYQPIGCLTSNSFSESAGVLETTTRSNPDGWGSSIPTTQTFNLSFSGIVTRTNSAGTIVSFADLKAIKRNRNKIDWQIRSQEDSLIESGLGHITSLSEDAGLDDFVTFSGEIQGTGLPISSAIPPTITNRWIEIDDAWVFKGVNTNVFAIEIGDMIRRYPQTNRYINARVNALPYTIDSNLTFFEDIQTI